MAKASDNQFPSVLIGEGSAPTSPPAGTQRVFIDSADHKFKRKDSSGTVTTIEGGGGGGGTRSYLGKNAVGASVESMSISASRTIRYKKITVSSAALLCSIQASITDSGAGAVGNLAFALYSDNAGVPQNLLAYGGTATADDQVVVKARARWLGVAMNYEVPAADYWIAVICNDTTNTMQIAYDTSGTDKTAIPGGNWLHDADFYTLTTGTKDYSIRALLLS